MKVTNIERTLVDVPFTPRQQEITTQSVSTVYNWSLLELCKVTTDTGHIGWGETVIHYTYSRVSDSSVERVLGQSPAEHMNDDSLGAGLQMALFDVVGKILEVPVYRLLGTQCREVVPISWWSIDSSPENWAAEAADAVANGYTSFKNKPRPWWDIIKQVEAIAEVVPTDFKLDLDPNSSLRDAETAIPILRKLAAHPNVAIFESPIPQGDVAGNKQIRQAVDCPIAMHFGSPPYTTCIREDVCDGFVIGGGKSRTMYDGYLSGAADMPFWLQIVGNGLTTTWAAHLGSVLTHATWPAITCLNLYSEHLLTKPIVVSDGCHAVPDAPGLGVEVDEAAIEKFRVPDEKLDVDGYTIHPHPRIIKTVVYPDGRRIHMAGDGLSYFNAGNGDAYVEGARLELTFDDGTKEWTELYEKALETPVQC
ncbi:MAG: mandelate racemase/muconate lactonizing enzyme family protein [Candidatus Poribacteria bacterium]|nr:mandelate racemase/muconate lactonizing enzyme family protein [Candidatus Poribacteria bacterium]